MSRLVSALPLCLALALPLAAKADYITFTLATPIEIGRPGATLTYIGTISAPITNTGLEYLNGDSFNLNLPLILNDTPFFTNAPLFLTPGTSYTGILFSLAVPTSTPAGLYSGFFTILGGPNSNSTNSLGGSAFVASITPEPSSFVLLGTGLLGAVGAARRKYRRL